MAEAIETEAALERAADFAKLIFDQAANFPEAVGQEAYFVMEDCRRAAERAPRGTCPGTQAKPGRLSCDVGDHCPGCLGDCGAPQGLTEEQTAQLILACDAWNRAERRMETGWHMAVVKDLLGVIDRLTGAPSSKEEPPRAR